MGSHPYAFESCARQEISRAATVGSDPLRLVFSLASHLVSALQAFPVACSREIIWSPLAASNRYALDDAGADDEPCRHAMGFYREWAPLHSHHPAVAVVLRCVSREDGKKRPPPLDRILHSGRSVRRHRCLLCRDRTHRPAVRTHAAQRPSMDDDRQYQPRELSVEIDDCSRSQEYSPMSSP